jgi:hypothetical protein
MRETSQIGSNYLFYNFIGMVKILLTREQLAWVNLFIHQRLNVEHSSNIIANVKNINITTQELTKNKELFHQ